MQRPTRAVALSLAAVIAFGFFSAAGSTIAGSDKASSQVRLRPSAPAHPGAPPKANAQPSASASSAGPCTASDPNGSCYLTGGYNINNNEWGWGHGWQQVWAQGRDHWGVHSVQPATNGVKSYPNVSRTIGRPLDQLSAVGSTFAFTAPRTGVWVADYDIWLNDASIEVMAWVNRFGVIQPVGAPVQTVNVAGASWTLWAGWNGFAETYSFVRNGNQTSGTVDIYHLLKWLETSKHYFSNPTLSTIQFGFEVTDTANTPQDFTVTAYSVSAN